MSLRVKTRAPIFLFISFVLSTAVAQQVVPVSMPSTSSTGTNASTLLQAFMQKAGWGIDWKSVSFSFSGTATVTNPDQSTTSLPIAGESQNRWNVRLDAASTTFIVKGQNAWLVSGNGPEAAPFDSVFEAASLLPFMSDLADVSDPTISTSYDGVTQFNGVPAYQFTLHRSATTDPTSSRRLSMQPTDTRVWFDQTTYLPIAIESTCPGLTNSSAGFRVRREYSNYNVISGIAVPFTVVESVEGFKSTFTVTSVQFGTSFSASDFEPK